VALAPLQQLESESPCAPAAAIDAASSRSATTPNDRLTGEASARTVVVRTAVERHVERRGLALESVAEPAEPAPTVNVTIGRIELRATQAAAASIPPRTASQTMSLQEYLGQRGRGGVG